MQRPEQNILNFLNSLRDIRRFDSLITSSEYRIFMENKEVPPLTRTQMQEYYNIKLRQTLDFLDNHPELKPNMIDSLVTVTGRLNIPEFRLNDILETVLHSAPIATQFQLLNQIKDVYKRTAFEFLWKNYYLVEQFKMVDPTLF